MVSIAQAKCPFCADATGYACRVSVSRNIRTITYACVKCQQRWQGSAEPMHAAPEEGVEVPLSEMDEKTS
jgi:transcription elongation factor Elf1